MKTEIIEQNQISCAIVNSEQVVIHDVRSALDFIMTIDHQTGCNRIALNKEAIAEDFFILSTGLAGEVLQKFVNYRMKLAIIGDFSRYTSKPLKDFIRESNRGNAIFFVPTQQQALDSLTRAGA